MEVKSRFPRTARRIPTTFYMIVGLIKPNEGRIFLENDEGIITDIIPRNPRGRLGFPGPTQGEG